MKRIASLVLVALTGCASAPGFHMDESKLQVAQPAVAQASGDDPVYSVIPITAALIAQQKTALTTEQVAKSNGELARQVADYHYRVGPQDVLNIIVFNHPDLTSPAGTYRSAEESGYVVSQAGTISFPYAGTVQVAGHTVAEIQGELARKLSVYLRNPQVNVRVAAFRSQKINVVGEVKKPGLISITDVPMTALDAISRAEGPTTEADLQNVIVTRNNHTWPIDLQSVNDRGNTAQNMLLQDGDLVNVSDRSQNKVYVMGEVAKSAAYQMNKGRMSLAEAIGGASGFSQSSDPRRIYVIRGALRKPTIYKLNGSAPDAILLATQFELKPHDVVYVAPAEVSRFNSLLGAIIPSLGVLPTLRP